MLELTRRRQKAWRERREHMEGIRQRAVARAAQVRHDNHAALISRLATLPATLTTDELKAYIDGKYKGRPTSFFDRLRRHRLMTYDVVAGHWVNHCFPEREQS
jgi:cell division protein ZapA (FtsZ GTPase activity inhibitor)